jgi:hypothetical protein
VSNTFPAILLISEVLNEDKRTVPFGLFIKKLYNDLFASVQPSNMIVQTVFSTLPYNHIDHFPNFFSPEINRLVSLAKLTNDMNHFAELSIPNSIKWYNTSAQETENLCMNLLSPFL